MNSVLRRIGISLLALLATTIFMAGCVRPEANTQEIPGSAEPGEATVSREELAGTWTGFTTWRGNPILSLEFTLYRDGTAEWKRGLRANWRGYMDPDTVTEIDEGRFADFDDWAAEFELSAENRDDNLRWEFTSHKDKTTLVIYPADSNPELHSARWWIQLEDGNTLILESPDTSATGQLTRRP